MTTSTPSRKFQEASASGMQVLQAVSRDPRAADELLQRLDMERHRHEEEISRLAAEKAALARYLANVYAGRTVQATPGRPQSNAASSRRASYSSTAPMARGLFGSPDSLSGPTMHLAYMPTEQGGGVLQAVPPPVVNRGMMAQTVALHGDSLTNPVSTAVSPDRADHPDRPRRSKTGTASRAQSVDERAFLPAPASSGSAAPAWAEQLVSTVVRLEKRMGRLEAGVITSLLADASSRTGSMTSPSRGGSVAGTPSRPPPVASGLAMTSPGGSMTGTAGPNAPPNIFSALQLRQDAMLANIAERLDVTVKHLVRDALAELMSSVHQGNTSCAAAVVEVKEEVSALRAQVEALKERSVEEASAVAGLAKSVDHSVSINEAVLARVQSVEASVQQEQRAAAAALHEVRDLVQGAAKAEQVSASMSALSEQMQARQAEAWADMQLALQQTLAKQAAAAAESALSVVPSTDSIAASCTTALQPLFTTIERTMQGDRENAQKGLDKVEASLTGTERLHERIVSHMERQLASLDALRAQVTAVQEQAVAREVEMKTEINQCTESLEDLSTNIGELKNSLVEVQAGQDVVEATLNSVPHTIKAALLQEFEASALGTAKCVQEAQAALDAALKSKTAAMERSVAALSTSVGEVHASVTSSASTLSSLLKEEVLPALAAQQAAVHKEMDKAFRAQAGEVQTVQTSLSSLLVDEIGKIERVLDSTVREACGAVQAQVATVSATVDTLSTLASSGSKEASQSLLTHVRGLEGRVEQVLTRVQQVQDGQTTAGDVQAQVAQSVREVVKDIQSTRSLVDSSIGTLTAHVTAQAVEQGRAVTAALTAQHSQLAKLHDAVSAVPSVEAVSSAVLAHTHTALKPLATSQQLQGVTEAQAALRSAVDSLKSDVASKDSAGALVAVQQAVEAVQGEVSQATATVLRTMQEVSKQHKTAIKEAVRADTSAVTASVQDLVEDKQRATASSLERVISLLTKLMERVHSGSMQKDEGPAQGVPELLQAVQKLAHGQAEAAASLSSVLEATRSAVSVGVACELHTEVVKEVQSVREHCDVRFNEVQRQKDGIVDTLLAELQSSSRHVEAELLAKLSQCLTLVQAVQTAVVHVGDKVTTATGQVLQAHVEGKGQLLEQARAHTALLQDIESGSLRQLRGSCSQILGMVQAEGDVLEEGGSTTATLAQHVAALNGRINDLGSAVLGALGGGGGGGEGGSFVPLTDQLAAVEMHLERGIDEVTRSVEQLSRDVQGLQERSTGAGHGGGGEGAVQAQLAMLESTHREQHGKLYASLRHIAEISMQAQLLLQGVQQQTTYLEENGATGRDFERVATAVHALSARLSAVEEAVHEQGQYSKGGMQSLNTSMHTMDTALAIAVGKKPASGLPPRAPPS